MAIFDNFVGVVVTVGSWHPLVTDLTFVVMVVGHDVHAASGVGHQAGGRRNDEMMQRLTDTITALKSELYELKVAQQQTTADDSADQIAALSNEIAVLSAQQKSVEQKILAAVNEGSAKYTPVVLPASLKWLDYILIAVVLVLIFSIGNMLLMAYIAKLIMQE